MRWAGAAALAGILLAFATDAAAQGDSCGEQLPASLIAAIPKTYPGYRAPLESDNDADDIAYSKAQRGNGCLGVAAGDFDGSRSKQFLLALTSANGQSGLVVVAHAMRDGWRFRRLQDWPGLRNRLFVERVQPGRYIRSDALDDPTNRDDWRFITCRHSGAGVGEPEVSETVYCSINGAWRHVQVSD
jgi:hypothetical protein